MRKDAFIKIKLTAMDLDETVLHNDGSIFSFTKQVLTKLVAYETKKEYENFITSTSEAVVCNMTVASFCILVMQTD